MVCLPVAVIFSCDAPAACANGGTHPRLSRADRARAPQGRAIMRKRSLPVGLAPLHPFLPYALRADRPRGTRTACRRQLRERRAIEKLNAFVGGGVSRLDELWHE